MTAMRINAQTPVSVHSNSETHIHHTSGGGETQLECITSCAKAQGYVSDYLRADGPWKGWVFQVNTWNVESLTGRAGEVVEALLHRKGDIACIQEIRCKVVDASSM